MPSILSTALLAMSLAASSGPSVVEVPLESSLEIRPAEGWTFDDCDALLGASELVTACTPDSFTVTGPAYDPSIEPARVAVQMRGPGGDLVVDYVIRLAEPSPASAPDTEVGVPIRAGSVALVPLSSLGLDCGLCSPGSAEIEVGALDRDDLGLARVTGSHLVFSSAPDVHGSVVIDLRVSDDIGTVSNTFKVTLHVSEFDSVSASGSASGRFHGLHLVREMGALELDASELLLRTGDSEDSEEKAIVASCGPAMHGSVRCAPDGRIEYTPPGDAVPAGDQFAVHLVSPSGLQTLASVTLTDAAAAASTPVAPAAGSTRAALDLALPRPVGEDEEEASGGVTSAFTELMDALGAR